MSSWSDEPITDNNAAGFAQQMTDPNATMDPSAFMTNQGQINPAQFAQQQPQGQQQPTAGDAMRHASPSFQNPAYQPNSVIPSKRSRPHEDSISGSPRQVQGMLPPSRSETPQQAFAPGQQPQGQFSHLQANGSANASPSPIMGNQMRPGSVPQRVSTASPHPFSPGGQQQFGAQNSPAPSDHGTPQPNQFMPPGYNQGFAPSPSNARPAPSPNAIAASQMMNQQMGQLPPGMTAAMYAQLQQQQQQTGGQQPQTPQQQQQSLPQQQQQQQHQQQQQQKMANYQMRLQQQLQGNMQNMQMQAMQAQGMGRGMVPGKPGMPGTPNGQMPAGAMRQPGRPGGMTSEQFMKNLSALMAARGLPFDPNPTIGERPINLMMLFQAVTSKGGYKTITTGNGWPHITQAIGFPPQHPQIPQAIKSIYERNLLKFEEAWTVQQKQRMSMQGQTGQSGTPQKPMQPGQLTPAQQQMLQQQQQQQTQQQQQSQLAQGQFPPQAQHPQTAGQPSQQHPQSSPQPQQHIGQLPQAPQHSGAPQQQTPMKPGQPPVNGFAMPVQHPSQPGMHAPRQSISRGPMDPNMTQDPTMSSPSMQRPPQIGMDARQGSMASQEPRVQDRPTKSDEYIPCVRELMTYGGIDLQAANMMGIELERWRPDVPPVNDLGNIDIHALTKSLQCGISSEIRMALDTLSALSNSPNPQHFIQLRYCEDLIDALIDIAEEQVERLTEHTAEVSDEIQLTSFEDVTRSCRVERWAVRELPEFGTEAYELDRSVDRLICITTILRNLSFPGEQNDNHLVLVDEIVLKFLCDLIRYLGTRTMLLRTNSNTLDFMKDVIVLLSNIAGSIELSSKDHALSLLSFLLAFAPGPAPTVVAGELLFTPYEPNNHPYLPHAIDALAKLLARDEPNRGFYKTIFGLEGGNGGGTESSYELLTKTFGMAISPLPDKSKDHIRAPVYPSLVETRKPVLMQGLLAAEILAFMAPGFDSGLPKLWLSPGNGLAQNLGRLIQELSQIFEHPQLALRGPPPPRGQLRKDPELVYLVVVAVTLLRTLAEKARDRNQPEASIPKSLLPSNKVLMDALTMQSPEWTKEGMLKELTSIVGMAR